MTPTNLEKLRAGITPRGELDRRVCTHIGVDFEATEALMRQAADEIEELRREVAALKVERSTLRDALDNHGIYLS